MKRLADATPKHGRFHPALARASEFATELRCDEDAAPDAGLHMRAVPHHQ